MNTTALPIQTQTPTPPVYVPPRHAFDKFHLAMISLVALVLCGLFYECVSRTADAAIAREQIAAKAAVDADKRNAELQTQSAAQITELRNENLALQSQITSLAAAVTARNAALTTQTQAVPTLTPTVLGAQWGTLANEPAPVLNGANFVVPLPLAQKSVIALMTVPSLQADKKDLQDEITKQNEVIKNDAAAFTTEKGAHLSDVAACKVDKTALNAEITRVKKVALRSKLRWFGAGFVSGITFGIVKF